MRRWLRKKLYEADKSYNAEQMMLFAFDSGNYTLPEGDNYCTREELVAKIAGNVDETIAGSIEWDLIDDAVMAVQPLAPYTESASVEKACQKVIRFAGKCRIPKDILEIPMRQTMLGQRHRR